MYQYLKIKMLRIIPLDDLSASGGFELLEPADQAVICSAKSLGIGSYLLPDFIKRCINNLIFYYYRSEHTAKGRVNYQRQVVSHFLASLFGSFVSQQGALYRRTS